jgi:hypothetical protein
MLSEMRNKTAKAEPRRTTMVPVTTMEEIPVLSDREREELLASLKDAEARLAAGEGIEYDPKTFKEAADRDLPESQTLAFMKYRVEFDPVALREIQQFADYLRAYEDESAIRANHATRIEFCYGNLSASPLMWMRMLAEWMSFDSGMRAAIQPASTSELRS